MRPQTGRKRSKRGPKRPQGKPDRNRTKTGPPQKLQRSPKEDEGNRNRTKPDEPGTSQKPKNGTPKRTQRGPKEAQGNPDKKRTTPDNNRCSSSSVRAIPGQRAAIGGIQAIFGRSRAKFGRVCPMWARVRRHRASICRFRAVFVGPEPSLVESGSAQHRPTSAQTGWLSVLSAQGDASSAAPAGQGEGGMHTRGRGPTMVATGYNATRSDKCVHDGALWRARCVVSRAFFIAVPAVFGQDAMRSESITLGVNRKNFKETPR